MPSLAGSVVPREVFDAFRFDGDIVGAQPVSGGHIHRNVLVTCTGGRYVLQRLNDRVFPDMATLSANVERIATHLHKTGRRGPDLVETASGALSFRAANGSTWRAFHFLEGTVGRVVPRGPVDAFEAARAFSQYREALVDLPGPPLAPTIDKFHDLHRRLDDMDAIAEADPVARRAQVESELDLAHSLGRDVADALDAAPESTTVHIVHNDAKLSNVRFDVKTGLAACVVDLDTTMVGKARHDVGELVRTVTTHGPEDARETSIVDFDLELLDAVARGYCTAGPDLEPSELEALALAGPEMAVENAVRFLSDHLAGDRYFAVIRPGQNLERCRTQLRLTGLMLEAHADVAACFARVARPERPPRPPQAGIVGGISRELR